MRITPATKSVALVIVGLVLAVGGIYFLKGGTLFVGSTRLVSVFDDVNGLSTGVPVVLKGFKVGTVDEISFKKGPDFILLVKYHIYDDIELPVGSEARIISSDLLGSKSLELIPGRRDRPVKDGDTLRGTVEPGFKPSQQFVDSMVGKVLNNLTE
jgi:phospholipid/cholesterol/gamma-HCH transport system substrate-binding protein